jgi:hypothetical protein
VAVLGQLFVDTIFLAVAAAGIVLCTRRLLELDAAYADDASTSTQPVVAVRATTAVPAAVLTVAVAEDDTPAVKEPTPLPRSMGPLPA